MITKNNILKIALNVFENEIKTLEYVKNQISDKFYDVVTLLSKCKGRIIITGIGKSAIISQKIVATLNSTGSSAIFLHAADAIHGDLGIIHPDDIILAISKSGNTEELKTLVNAIQNYDNKIISLTSNLESFLAKNSDLTLHIPISSEADPYNLVPTSSTSAQLVMGDAIAIALMQVKSFTPRQFGLNHPGGMLGKSLHTLIGNTIDRKIKPCVLSNASVKETIIEMTSHRQGSAAVIENTGKVIGIITDGDLRRMLIGSENLTLLTASDIMTPDPECINSNKTIHEALRIMQARSITQLIVKENDIYIGIIHIHDILKLGIN